MLDIESVSHDFGRGFVLEDVSLEVRDGQLAVLLGPNGAGKSTLLRILAGLLTPSKGSISIEGHRPGGADEWPSHLRRLVGFLPEVPGLWGRLTVEEHLYIYASLQGVAAVSDAVNRTAGELGIDAVRGRTVATLSKGTQQKVALARALLHDPRVLVLDEPTSGLDPEMADHVVELIDRTRQRGRTVILSTHDLDEAERLASRIVVVQRRVLANGTVGELLGRVAPRAVLIELDEATPSTAVAVSRCLRSLGVETHRTGRVDAAEFIVEGSDITNRVPDIVAALVSGGLRIRRVLPRAATLREVYRRLVHTSVSDS